MGSMCCGPAVCRARSDACAASGRRSLAELRSSDGERQSLRAHTPTHIRCVRHIHAALPPENLCSIVCPNVPQPRHGGNDSGHDVAACVSDQCVYSRAGLARVQLPRQRRAAPSSPCARRLCGNTQGWHWSASLCPLQRDTRHGAEDVREGQQEGRLANGRNGW